MEQIKNELKQVFELLTVIPVSGDSVEIMAMTKEKLRKVYLMIEKNEKKEEANGGQNNRGTAAISADK